MRCKTWRRGVRVMNKHGRMGTKMGRCLFQVFTLLCALAASSAPASSLYFVHTDHLGTPQKITDGAQQVIWEGNPMPFGETEVVVNQIDFHVRLPGQYFDGEAGLHYNYYRDYDPSIGRYVQSDPIGLNGGLNTYGYTYQNPLIYTDPFGLASVAGCANPAYAAECAAAGIGAGGRAPDAVNAGGARLFCWLTGLCSANEEDASGSNHCPTPENPSWPGDDPTTGPPGTEWKGAPGSTPGDGRGNYHNPDTGESYRPDLDHPDPIGPHWDYHGPDGEKGRFYPDGSYEPK